MKTVFRQWLLIAEVCYCWRMDTGSDSCLKGCFIEKLKRVEENKTSSE
jgi:hypothetical protein